MLYPPLGPLPGGDPGVGKSAILPKIGFACNPHQSLHQLNLRTTASATRAGQKARVSHR